MPRGSDDQSEFSLYETQFEVVRADTPALLDRVYRLRYQVYCVENAFEDPAQNLGGREIDIDDDRAAHILLIHRESGEAAGTARVIFPDKRRERLLPVEHALEPTAVHCFRDFPLQSTGEISRFAVSKAFRRRRGEIRHADNGFSPDTETAALPDRRIMPFITFGLLRGVLAICLERGLSHVTALMEPPLLRLLKRFALEFQPLGDLVEHHGLRQPCIALVHDLVSQVRDESSPLWPHFDLELSQSANRLLRPTLA